MTTTETEPVRVAANSGSPSRGLKYGIVIGIVGVVLAGAAVIKYRGGASAAPSGAPAENRPVPVQVVAAAVTDVPVVLEGLGNVTSLATVTVRTQVDGRLDKVAFKEGQNVKKGQLLALVDPRPFQIQLLNAQAALARDTAQLQNAQLNLERFTTLRGQNLVSQQQLDDQKTLVAQADAALNADKSSIQAARLQLDFARIVSPIDGVTGVRMVDQGNLVRASDGAGIVVVTQLDPIGVMFTLPEDSQPQVSKALAEGPVTVDAFNRDGTTLLASGRLLVVDNQINSTTATIRLKATFANADKRLWPNAFVKARLTLGTRRGVIAIPNAAIQQGPQGTFVYAVGPDQTAIARNVQIDFVQNDTAVISKGLSAAEMVVTEGQGQLRPGAKIAPRAKASTPDADKRTTPGSSETPPAPAASSGSAKPLGGPR